MRKFLCVVSMAIKDAFEYRTDVFIYVLSGMARPIIFLAIWLAALSSGVTTSFSKEDFIQYYLLVMVLGAWNSAWSSVFIMQKIKDGRLSPFLLRPFSYIFFDLGNNFGEKIFKLFYALIVAIILGAIFKISLPTFSGLEIVILGTSLIGCLFLNYLFDFCIGLLAFWTSEAYSFGDFIDLFIYIFSGLLFPLALLPRMFQNIAAVLPFRYFLSFPVELFLQKLTVDQMYFGLTMQILWLVIVIVLLFLMWKFGLKKYSAVGA